MSCASIHSEIEDSATSAEEVKLSDQERYLIRHALGMGPVNAAKVAYRNRYIVSKGADQFDAWMALVDRGLAVVEAADGQRVCFYAGGRAARAVLRKGESIDREITAMLGTIDTEISEVRHG